MALVNNNIKIDHVIVLAVDPEIIIKRISGRGHTKGQAELIILS